MNLREKALVQKETEFEIEPKLEQGKEVVNFSLEQDPAVDDNVRPLLITLKQMGVFQDKLGDALDDYQKENPEQYRNLKNLRLYHYLLGSSQLPETFAGMELTSPEFNRFLAELINNNFKNKMMSIENPFENPAISQPKPDGPKKYGNPYADDEDIKSGQMQEVTMDDILKMGGEADQTAKAAAAGQPQPASPEAELKLEGLTENDLQQIENQAIAMVQEKLERRQLARPGTDLRGPEEIKRDKADQLALATERVQAMMQSDIKLDTMEQAIVAAKQEAERTTKSQTSSEAAAIIDAAVQQLARSIAADVIKKLGEEKEAGEAPAQEAVNM